MNEELINLIFKYPDLTNKLSVEYRKELFITYYKLNPIENVAGYVRVADAYNKAKLFKVSSISKTIQEIFGLKQDNANMQIRYAKEKGLITESVKTNGSKGYLQKNYKGNKHNEE